jgi:predicted DsbA family dithiol-disulfide isomerase
MKVFSDYICPFCFVGKRRVDRLEEELAIRPVWKAFEIHPERPPEGVPIERRFSPGAIARLREHVGLLAAEVGLEMRVPEKLSNSRPALMGGEFAKESGRFEHYHEAVFSAYFLHGKDIGDVEILVDIADGVGIETDPFREAVAGQKHAGALRASRQEADSLGLTAVPSFVFVDGTIVVGAQPYKVLRTVAEKAFRDTS